MTKLTKYFALLAPITTTLIFHFQIVCTKMNNTFSHVTEFMIEYYEIQYGKQALGYFSWYESFGYILLCPDYRLIESLYFHILQSHDFIPNSDNV